MPLAFSVRRKGIRRCRILMIARSRGTRPSCRPTGSFRARPDPAPRRLDLFALGDVAYRFGRARAACPDGTRGRPTHSKPAHRCTTVSGGA